MLNEEHRRAWFRHGHGHGRGAFREIWGLGFNKEWGGWRAGRIRPLRRGEMKYVVLETLLEGPKHGYEIITAIEQRRNVRPSAGSIYPTLQMLEDGGFVTSDHVDGKRTYAITDAGRAMLNERDGESDEPDENGPSEAHHRLREAAAKLASAVLNARGSSDETLEKIRDVLKNARKEIYDILGDDED
jgi:DNA-binding PadR family transcriptional regulator